MLSWCVVPERDSPESTTIRHFTATGFVIHDDHVLLHWHRKVKAWLPPGGHVEANEDPVQAVLREIEEETGTQAEVASTGPDFELAYPTQVMPPFTIMVEDIHDPATGYHQHIDMIYFCRLASSPNSLNEGWIWVSRADLANSTQVQYGDSPSEPPPEDVRLLAEKAFDFISD